MLQRSLLVNNYDMEESLLGITTRANTRVPMCQDNETKQVSWHKHATSVNFLGTILQTWHRAKFAKFGRRWSTGWRLPWWRPVRQGDPIYKLVRKEIKAKTSINQHWDHCIFILFLLTFMTNPYQTIKQQLSIIILDNDWTHIKHQLLNHKLALIND